MNPKHDLRGGNTPDDSFAMSKSVFVASTNRCFFVAESREVWTTMIAGIHI